MTAKELSELTDQELKAEAKKMNSSKIVNAFLIGFLVGIVIFSLVKNSFGFFALIPLYFAYRLFNNPKNKEANKALEEELAARDLK